MNPVSRHSSSVIRERPVPAGSVQFAHVARRASNQFTVTRRFLASVLTLGALIVIGGCAETPEELKKDPVDRGIYQTWDDVINRWIGQKREDLGYELGPPTFHKESDDGYTELVWDMTYPNAAGQAQMYNLLPLYGGNVNCKLVYIADPNGIIVKGQRVGCD